MKRLIGTVKSVSIYPDVAYLNVTDDDAPGGIAEVRTVKGAEEEIYRLWRCIAELTPPGEWWIEVDMKGDEIMKWDRALERTRERRKLGKPVSPYFFVPHIVEVYKARRHAWLIPEDPENGFTLFDPEEGMKILREAV